jgi:predicted pyridoxine 5'-phosphate oxidase superfamily flavin-nucleotide-binding protein
MTLFASSSHANAQPKFRVSWQSTTTGFVGHGLWIDENAAIMAAKNANVRYPTLRHWVDKKRKLLFIPLPSKRITLTDTTPNENPLVPRGTKARTLEQGSFFISKSLRGQWGM